jgi:hypothetical protein
LQLGSPGEHQLNVLPRHVMGTTSQLHYHPFRFIGFKKQAYICKRPANRSADCLPDCGSNFFVDFGFMRVSANDYKWPNKATDRIVLSYDGFSAYFAIVDGASRRVWCFLAALKEPPLHILCAFMSKFGCGNGMIRSDQGGKLAQSDAFCMMMLDEFGYVVKPTGADSPSQNGGAKIYNGTLAEKSALSSTAQDCPHSSGPLPSSTQCTFTTGWHTLLLARLRTKVGMAASLASRI